MNFAVANCYAGHETATAARGDYAKQPGAAVLAGSQAVFHIGAVRNVAQIAKSIIESVAVDMVNIVFRPNAGHVEPSEPMGLVTLAKYNDNRAIFGLVGVTGNLSRLGASTVRKPSENPGFGAIIDSFEQVCVSDHDLSIPIGGDRE